VKDELAQVERFDQVVLGSSGESLLLGLGIGQPARSENGHEAVPGKPILDLLEQSEDVETRHGEVEDHEVRSDGSQQTGRCDWRNRRVNYPSLC
jgi:hypothetical protein